MKSNSEKLEQILTRNKRMKFKEIQEALSLTEAETEKIITELRERRPNLVYAKYDRTFYFSDTPTWYSHQTDLSKHLPKIGSFGLVSDTHLGSHAERLDVLNTAYDVFKKEGISCVFHTGD